MTTDEKCPVCGLGTFKVWVASDGFMSGTSVTHLDCVRQLQREFDAYLERLQQAEGELASLRQDLENARRDHERDLRDGLPQKTPSRWQPREEAT